MQADLFGSGLSVQEEVLVGVVGPEDLYDALGKRVLAQTRRAHTRARGEADERRQSAHERRLSRVASERPGHEPVARAGRLARAHARAARRRDGDGHRVRALHRRLRHCTRAVRGGTSAAGAGNADGVEAGAGARGECAVVGDGARGARVQTRGGLLRLESDARRIHAILLLALPLSSAIMTSKYLASATRNVFHIIHRTSNLCTLKQ